MTEQDNLRVIREGKINHLINGLAGLAYLGGKAGLAAYFGENHQVAPTIYCAISGMIELARTSSEMDNPPALEDCRVIHSRKGLSYLLALSPLEIAIPARFGFKLYYDIKNKLQRGKK